MSRYVRQTQFAPIGTDGQTRLGTSRVVVLGCGALGSVAAELLARAGVGRLRLIDRDVVELSNLQRQSLYTEADAVAATAKVEAAANQLRRINSEITIDELAVDVTAGNIAATVGQPDLVIDASDNFSLRLLLNDHCLANSIPWVHGGCVGATGQVRLFVPDDPATTLAADRFCFRCVVPEPPDPSTVATCDTAGVLGPATHLIASCQAGEAIKWLSGNRDAVHRNWWSIDLWNNRFRSIPMDGLRAAACPACGDRRFDFLEEKVAIAGRATRLCGRDAVQISGRSQTVDLLTIATRWEAIGTTQTTRFFVRLQLDELRGITLFRDGRAVISGTEDLATARSLYDRFVGS